jgi:hypothetical protein
MNQAGSVSNSHAFDHDAESDNLEEIPCDLQLFLDTQDYRPRHYIHFLLPGNPGHHLCPWSPGAQVGLCLPSLLHHPPQFCWNSQVIIYLLENFTKPMKDASWWSDGSTRLTLSRWFFAGLFTCFSSGSSLRTSCHCIDPKQHWSAC